MKGNKILTGIQPSGEIHIGNYFGTIKNIVELQKENEVFLFIADLHALTSVKKHSKKIYEYTEDLILSCIALGVDPKKTVIYRQSDFPQFSELMWILMTLTTLPYLERTHAYKALAAESKEINFGIISYPILMAADILLPSASLVPVGKDQAQHLELAREWARKFNNSFGDFFTEPKEYITEDIDILGVDGRKMSKSYNNTIPVFADEDTVRKIISGIKTDSKAKGEPLDSSECTVFHLCKVLGCNTSELQRKYSEGSIGYKESKEILLHHFLEYFKEAREVKERLGNNTKKVEKILEKNKKKLDKEFNKRMSEIRQTVGLIR